jgi:hypothetical protein
VAHSPDEKEGNMKTVLLDPADTVMLLLDHQNGLFQTVSTAGSAAACSGPL